MKTIVTLDKADQPFGFPQLNENGNLVVGNSNTASNSFNSSIIGGSSSFIYNSDNSAIIGGVGLTLSNENSVVLVPQLKIATASNVSASRILENNCRFSASPIFSVRFIATWELDL